MLTREQVKAALEEVGAAAKEIGKKVYWSEKSWIKITSL